MNDVPLLEENWVIWSFELERTDQSRNLRHRPDRTYFGLRSSVY